MPSSVSTTGNSLETQNGACFRPTKPSLRYNKPPSDLFESLSLDKLTLLFVVVKTITHPGEPWVKRRLKGLVECGLSLGGFWEGPRKQGFDLDWRQFCDEESYKMLSIKEGRPEGH